MERKIATSLEVLIKVAQYESIRLTKYGEAKIEYKSEEDRIEQENKLQDDVSADLIRTMRALPDKLGKKTNAVIDIEEKIKKRIPEWLEKGPEPNIADDAKQHAEKSENIAYVENEQRKNKNSNEETDSTTTEMEELFSPSESKEEKPEDKKEDTSTSDEKPLEDKEEKPEDISEDSAKLEDDFDDEDLFA